MIGKILGSRISRSALLVVETLLLSFDIVHVNGKTLRIRLSAYEERKRIDERSDVRDCAVRA